MREYNLSCQDGQLITQFHGFSCPCWLLVLKSNFACLCNNHDQLWNQASHRASRAQQGPHKPQGHWLPRPTGETLFWKGDNWVFPISAVFSPALGRTLHSWSHHSRQQQLIAHVCSHRMLLRSQRLFIFRAGSFLDELWSGLVLVHSTETVLPRVINDFLGVIHCGHYSILIIADLSSSWDCADHIICCCNRFQIIPHTWC